MVTATAATTLTPGLPPGPPGLPMLGHLPQLNSNPTGFFRSLATNYGPVATYHAGRQAAVLLSHPAGIQQVLVGQAKRLSIQEYNHVMRPVVGRSLLTTEGDEHLRLRRMMHGAFSTHRVAIHGDTVVAHTERMMESWAPGQPIELFIEMARCTQAIMADVVCGITEHDQAVILSDAFRTGFQLVQYRWLALAFLVVEQAVGRAVHSVFPQRGEPGAFFEYLCRGPVGRVPGTPFYRLRVLRETVESVIDPVIRQRRAAGTDRGDVLSALLDARDGEVAFDDAALKDQLITLLIGGASFSPLGLTYILYLLAKYPEVDGKVHDELSRVLGGRPPRAEDLEHLPYLDQVWSESLRLYPPAFTMSRYCKEEIEVEGYTLPAGTMVTVSPWVTQRLPEFFQRPNEFRPERFDPESGERYPPYTYFPFGAGMRRCIGEPFATFEGKLLLATLLQRFALRLVPGQSDLYIPRLAHGMRLNIQPRVG